MAGADSLSKKHWSIDITRYKTDKIQYSVITAVQAQNIPVPDKQQIKNQEPGYEPILESGGSAQVQSQPGQHSEFQTS